MQSGHRIYEQTIQASPEAVAPVRAQVARLAAEAGASPTQVDGIRLAVSEAITNAVVHAYRGASGPISISATVAGAELWILIADEGVGLEPQADRPGLGLGLGLIAQLSDDFSIGTRSHGGTEVRIGIRLPARQPSAGGSATGRDRARAIDVGALRRSGCTPSVLTA